MGRGYLVVEGHGEVLAAGNLINRLWLDLKLVPFHWATPIRGKNLHQERGVRKACELVKTKGDAQLLILLRDEDDGCPKDLAPLAADWLRRLNLPFPAGIVLAHREFEAFFLPCISNMAGRKIVGLDGIQREGLRSNTVYSGNPESLRGVKEWLSAHMPPGRAYKPTLDQLPLTRMVDFQLLCRATPPLPCFGSLESALKFLAGQMRLHNCGVYPWRETGVQIS